MSIRSHDIAARLVSPDTTVEERQQLVNTFRDNIEDLMTGADESQDAVINSMIRVLDIIPPQSSPNSQHKLRKSILEVINRIPHTEVLKEHVFTLSRALLKLATGDNQENAIVAVKVVLDLLRAFKPPLEEVAIPSLNLVTQLYDGWEEMFHYYFNDINLNAPNTTEVLNMDMQPSARSFKVIAECPITVLHLVQLYNADIRAYVSRLISLMVKALSFDSTREISTYVQQAFKDMKFAQVKTVAFLSQMVSKWTPIMQPHQQEICDGLMNLLKTCPDVVYWRRELLLSTRTLLATEFRKTLDGRLNDLRDETAIVGSSRSCYEALRHYGYAVFAELALQTRQSLKLDQLSWIVHRSCCIVSDGERPPPSHCTAVRLLLHLVEAIHKQRIDSEGGNERLSRDLLQKILVCFTTKLSSVKRTKKQSSDIQLLQNLFLGLRTVLYSLTTFSWPSNQPNQPTPPVALTEMEIRYAVKMIKGGIEGLRMCIGMNAQASVSDLTEIFVEAFNVLDPRDFVEIVSARIAYIYESLRNQSELHPMVSLLMEKAKTGLYFLTVLAGYLTDEKLPVLDNSDQEEFRFVLKLFRLILQYLTKPDIHNIILMGDTKTIPLISTLVKIAKVSIDKATTSKSSGYLQLLFFLFKYLSRSKLNFPEMAIMLPGALDLFLAMLDGPDIGINRDMLIELCLLLPLELEKKYPVLPKLMKPLLLALKGSDELALLGIQTMEEWIDRLNPDFLEPAMAALVQDINLALWSHLKPQAMNSLGTRVLQLLGKLGGRNRRFLAEPLQLEWKDNQEDGLRIVLTFQSKIKFLVPLDKSVSLTCQSLSSRRPAVMNGDPENVQYYRRQGMLFLHICLSSMMNISDAAGRYDGAKLKALIKEGHIVQRSHPEAADDTIKIKSQYLAEKSTMTTLISSALILCADRELKDEAAAFARGVAHHFALLFHLQRHDSSTEPSALLNPSRKEDKIESAARYIEPDIFIDAVMEVLSNEQTPVSRCGARALSWFLEMLLETTRLRPRSDDGPSRIAQQEYIHDYAKECGLPSVVNTVLDRVVDCCFSDNWGAKSGGMYGIKVLVDMLPVIYLNRVLPVLVRTLLHLMNTIPSHAISLQPLLLELLMKLVERIVSVQPVQETMEYKQAIGKLCQTVFQLNISERVRQDCHQCLNLICRTTRKSLTELLDPFVSLQQKSLRKALDECAQASAKYKQHRSSPTSFAVHLEGLSRLLVYCIQQKLPSVPHHLQEIKECVEFAILLCDNSEEHFIQRNSTRPDRATLVANMKVSAMKMLATMVKWDTFMNSLEFGDTNKTMEAMTLSFFKMLRSSEGELRDIAKEGLTHLIQVKKIIAYECQSALNPIIQRLSDIAELDLNVLKAGAEALRMFPDWPHLPLGEQLLEHLRKWTEPDPTSYSLRKPWPLAEDTKIAAAILELFHLFHDPQSSFLESQSGTSRIGLFVTMIELEARLGHPSPTAPVPHVLWSPYRSPLTKYLIKYKKEAVKYFMEPTRMQNASYVTRFIDIIGSDIGQPLLLEVLASTQQLMNLLQYDSDPHSGLEMPSMAPVHALQLIRKVVKLRPDWLPTQRPLFLCLINNWRNIDMKSRANREEHMSFMELFECKSIAKCIVNYISVHHNEVGALIDLLSVFEYSSKVDFTFVKEFCMEFVPSNFSHSELRDVLFYAVTHLSVNMSQSKSIFVARFLVSPILKSLNKKKETQNVVTPEIIQAYMDQTKPQEKRDVCLEVELLEVGQHLLIGASVLWSETLCRMLIKYGWNFLKSENIECKSHAFLLVAYNLKTAKLWPDKVTLQVFVNLLKSDFSETKRELVQEALDVMAPVLVEQFRNQTQSGTFPVWMEYAIKHMMAEGHKLNLLMNLWQMVIGNPDLFYEYRSQFLGQMVNTLSRLRRPPTNQNSENRQMAIDLERVIVDWEVKRVNGGGKESSSHISPPPLIEGTSTNMKKMVVALLAKTLFTALESSKSNSTAKYSYNDILGILDRALEVWPDVEFRLDFVERLIEGNQIQQQQTTLIVNAGLDLMALALKHQPVLFLEHGWHYVISLSQKVASMKKEDALEKLCQSLELVFSVEQHNTPLNDALESGLLTKYLDPASMPGHQGTLDPEISTCLKILDADKNNRSGLISRFLSFLVKLLDKYAEAYLRLMQTGAPVASPTPPPSDPDAVPTPNFGNHMYNICKIIKLCSRSMQDLCQSEKDLFVRSMTRFLPYRGNRPPDRAIFYHILVTVSDWMKDMIQNGESPTVSQKPLMLCMQQISRVDANGLVEPCMRKHFDTLFLTTFYDFCTTGALNQDVRRDVFLHIEQMMQSGIRTTTPEIRHQFFQIYQNTLGNSLFERLSFILQSQEWEYVASRFWLKQALDYILAFLDNDIEISFAPKASLLVPLARPNSLDPSAMDIDSTSEDKAEALLAEHAQFIQNKGSFATGDLMTALREHAHVNPNLAYRLWITIFPIAWATLEKNRQIELAKPIITILSKQYHFVQAHNRPNVIQGLLQGISLSQPQPKIPAELLKYLCKTYNAWHISIPLMESNVVIFPDDTRCFDALAELYSNLNETDMMFGLFKKRFKSEYTQSGINLMQFGYWEEALHIFGEAAVQESEKRIGVFPREVLLWSEEWCRCAKELNQWEELHNWAGASKSMALLADASWRLPDPDWTELRQLLQNNKDQFPDRLQYSMLNIYCSLQESNSGLINGHMSQAIDQCIQRWWQLPEIGILGQVELLQKFQQVVEVCESSRYCLYKWYGPSGVDRAVYELNNPGRAGGRHEQGNFTKDILETWRLRSPNVWEPLSVWSDIFVWRHIIYSGIDNSISSGPEPNSPSLHHLCVKDKAWSINRLANVARKHGALEVCIDIENNMYNDNYMDVQEAFLKIVEQAKAYLLMDGQRMAGLKMLCNTNLEYFPYQGLQSEIFRLQGEYYRALDDPEKANQAYSTSISLNSHLPEAWLCWGSFCDDMYEKNKSDPSSARHQLEYAVGCYFQAMQLHSPAAKAMIPRCLQLLSFDQTGTVDKVFTEVLCGNDMIPSWYWLFYIPQILSVLHRQEGQSLRFLLPKMVASHPQALYYFLRVHMLNTRDAANAVFERRRQATGRENQCPPGNQGEGGQTATVQPSAVREDPATYGSNNAIISNFDTVKEWMDRLKHQLGGISNTLEMMLREIASNFMAKPEERLMAVVHVLLARCFKVAGSLRMEIPYNLIREIDEVCKACFSETRASSSMHKDLKESFVKELSPSNDNFPKTLGELTDRLKKLRNTLNAYLEEKMPSILQLHRESQTLQDLTLHGVEMPCQYTKSPDPIMDAPVYLEKIGSEIHAIRRQGTAFRRISFYDSDGRKTHFILQNGHTSGQPASSDERMLQLMSLLNRLLNKHNQCRNRFLNFFVPVIVPVWNKVRLVEDDPCFTAFLEAFEVNCQRMGRETDFPVISFKRKIYAQGASPNSLAPQAFNEISETIADNIFSQYMYKILPSANHFWVFKKQFCNQMALSSLLSVMLSIGGRVPGKILFSRSSGKVMQVDFVPQANVEGFVHQNEEAVPFRLTRNLAAFFTPFGVEGVFMTAMVVASMALTQRHSNLIPCLSLFFRDELLAWASRKESRSHFTSSMAHLQPIVEGNVATAVSHIQNLCPVVPKMSPESTVLQGAINSGIEELVSRATDPRNLCTMDPTWHPWY